MEFGLPVQRCLITLFLFEQIQARLCQNFSFSIMVKIKSTAEEIGEISSIATNASYTFCLHVLMIDKSILKVPTTLL